jgi:hypothetical protein
MSFEENETENLFSYGTLQTEAVQLATFGRRLEAKPDTLAGYSLTMIRIENQNFMALSGTAYHRNIQFTVTKKELEQADAYEPADYKRTLVQLKSGINAWVYVNLRS